VSDAVRRSALVITASDGAAAGVRSDLSGARVGERLEALGFAVERRVVSDERAAIEAALISPIRNTAALKIVTSSPSVTAIGTPSFQ